MGADKGASRKRLSLTQKIHLRHEEVKRWKKKCRVKKIQKHVIDDILRDSTHTSAQAYSFISNARSLGFNPVNFNNLVHKAPIKTTLKEQLLRETRMLPSAGCDNTNSKDSNHQARSLDFPYRVCSRPYLPGIKQAAEVGHEALKLAIMSFEKERKDQPSKHHWAVPEPVSLQPWFEKTTKSDQPIRVTVMRIGRQEKRNIALPKEKFPLWGAIMICVLEGNSPFDSSMTFHTGKAFEEPVIVRDGHMMIITPKSIHSSTAETTSDAGYVLTIMF